MRTICSARSRLGSAACRNGRELASDQRVGRSCDWLCEFAPRFAPRSFWPIATADSRMNRTTRESGPSKLLRYLLRCPGVSGRFLFEPRRGRHPSGNHLDGENRGQEREEMLALKEAGRVVPSCVPSGTSPAQGCRVDRRMREGSKGLMRIAARNGGPRAATRGDAEWDVPLSRAAAWVYPLAQARGGFHPRTSAQGSARQWNSRSRA